MVYFFYTNNNPGVMSHTWEIANKKNNKLHLQVSHWFEQALMLASPGNFRILLSMCFFGNGNTCAFYFKGIFV